MSFKYGDEMVRPLILRFNSGAGALMCDCGKIMATGWNHEGKTYECKCGSLHQIVKLETEDPSVYIFGALNY